DSDRGDPVQQPGAGLLVRGPPHPRVDLGAVRVRSAALPERLAGVGIAHHYLCRLGRRVDPGNQRHRTSSRCFTVSRANTMPVATPSTPVLSASTGSRGTRLASSSRPVPDLHIPNGNLSGGAGGKPLMAMS